MGTTFAYRSDTTVAYYADGDPRSRGIGQVATTTTTQIIDYDAGPQTLTSWIGTKALDLDYKGLNMWRDWNATGNYPGHSAGSTVVTNYRFAFNDTSTGTIFGFGVFERNHGRLEWEYHVGTGFIATMYSALAFNGGVDVLHITESTWQTNFPDAFAAYDLTVKLVNTTTGLEVTYYMNGTKITSTAFTRDWHDGLYTDGPPFVGMVAGGSAFDRNSSQYLNEWVIHDGDITDGSIASFFTGPSRSTFWSTTAKRITETTDPGIANVNSGTGYTFEGNSLTGILALTNYSDPGVANVAAGVTYIYADATLTGTLSVPIASSGTASQAPIANIKENIRSVLTLNNTTTGAPVVDLSQNLDTRVTGTYKLNPQQIPLLGNAIPGVCVFTDSKTPITIEGIVKNQTMAKRKATVNLKVAGMVWEPNFTQTKTHDPVDDQIEYLMENVEQILRGYDTLGGNVSWHFPSGITYHSATFDEESHFRVGVMDIEAKLFY